MLNIEGTARFVSDLHLQAGQPEIAARFVAFLEDTAAAGIDALFILGDLFEYWLGDDELSDPFNARIGARLHTLLAHGTRIYFLPGNRDFLVGARFAAASGMELLGNSIKVGVGGTATLLMHGDTLCTDDVAYQDFRRRVRATQWQERFLARPLQDRRAEAEALRRRSAEAMRGKTAEIMDVNPVAVRTALEESGCARLIHGHTHRPGRETIALAGGRAERWVLSDWAAGRGDALELDGEGIRRLSWATLPARAITRSPA